jgi:methionine-S-sulfoxide reductase
MTEKQIVLGGGCFWCIEAIFQRIKGVKLVESGYSGGLIDSPSYEEICTGTTGHAEVVRLTYDTNVISLNEIIEIFLQLHNPTTLNRQGSDKGTQYRSVVFYNDANEKEIIEEQIRLASKDYSDPIVTEVSPLSEFYKAEDYHQNYYNTHSSQGYCQVVISPKLTKLKEKYFTKLKDAV